MEFAQNNAGRSHPAVCAQHSASIMLRATSEAVGFLSIT